MPNSITNSSYSSSASSSIFLSTEDRLKQRQQMRLAQMVVQAENLESTLIDNEGEVAGKRLENENALKNQSDNEQSYKKQQRHKIIHAIVSFFAHVISLVMLVVRPVKSIAKMVTKGIKKAVSKAAGKSLRKTAGHMMKHIGKSAKNGIGKSVKHAGHKGAKLVKSGTKAIKSLSTGSEKAAAAKKLAKNIAHPKQGVFARFMKSDFGRLVKRQALVNGSAAAVNGIGDGVTNVQTAKIEKRVNDRDNQNALTEMNEDMLEQQKKQQLENSKEVYQNKEDNIKLANNLLKHANDISSAFINQAA